MNATCYKCGNQAKRYQSEEKRGILCALHKAEYSASYYENNKNEIIKRTAKWNVENREKVNERNRINYFKRKEESINRYGGKCAYCGEKELVFLTIDHINNNGGDDRRSWGNKISDIHRMLKNKNYPSGYQILCGNCNFKKEMQRRRSQNSLTWMRNQRAREKVIEAYGSECKCCHISDIDTLVIDHINGGGSKEKLTYPSKNVYLFLVNKELNELKFQILCQSCNQAKASLGMCPHSN